MALSQQYVDFIKNLFSGSSVRTSYYSQDDLNNSFGTDGKRFISTQERAFTIPEGNVDLNVISSVWSSQFGTTSIMIPTYLDNRVNFVEMTNISTQLPRLSTFTGDLSANVTNNSSTPINIDWNDIGENVLFNIGNAFLISGLREGFWMVRYISGTSPTVIQYSGKTFISNIGPFSTGSVEFELIKISSDTGKVIKRIRTTVSRFGSFNPGEDSVHHGFEMPGCLLLHVGSGTFIMIDSEDGTYYGTLTVGSYFADYQQGAFLYSQAKFVVDLGDFNGSDGTNDAVYINMFPNWKMIEFAEPPVNFWLNTGRLSAGTDATVTVQKSSLPTQRHWATPDSNVIHTRVELWNGSKWVKVKTSPDNEFTFTVPEDFPKTPEGKIRLSSGFLWSNELLFDDKFIVKDIPIFSGVASLPSIEVPFPNDATKKENLDYIRTKVNEFRFNNGLPNYMWKDELIIRNHTPIKAEHWNEVSDAIKQTYEFSVTPFKSLATEKILTDTIKPNDKVFYPLHDLKNRINKFIDAMQNR